MADYTSQQITSKDQWEAYVISYAEANFLQSWNWGEFHAGLHHAIERRGYFIDGTLVGVMLAIVEPAKRGRHLVVPAGPLLDWNDQQLVDLWRQDMSKLAKQHRCVFVRVRPQLLDTPQNRRIFTSLGFKKAPMHLHAELTSQLDLRKTEDQLRSAIRKGTRYDLNRALRMEIQVESTEDDRYMDEFYDLQLQTAERHGFVPFTKRFLHEQFRVFAADKQVLMYRSTYQGQLLAMAFVIFYGQEAAYHYGASTDEARKIPGAYAVQWQAIQHARERGCSRYNFWGVTGHGQTDHRFYGVSVFKRGFGGDDVAYVPAHDLPISVLKYPLTYVFETARRKARHLS